MESVGMVGIRGAGMVRVEIGQRHHRKDFAGVDVHDQPGGALRGEIVDDPLQFLAKNVLEAEVERQLQAAPAGPSACSSSPRSIPAKPALSMPV